MVQRHEIAFEELEEVLADASDQDELLIHTVADGREKRIKVLRVRGRATPSGRAWHVGTTPPDNPNTGDGWWDTSNDKLLVWDGSAWVDVGGGAGDVTTAQLNEEIKLRTAGDDLQSIGVSTEESYNNAVTAQRTSDIPLEIVFGADVSGSLDGEAYAYSENDVIRFAPRSDSPERRFNVGGSTTGGLNRGQVDDRVKAHTGQTSPDSTFAEDRIPGEIARAEQVNAAVKALRDAIGHDEASINAIADEIQALKDAGVLDRFRVWQANGLPGIKDTDDVDGDYVAIDPDTPSQGDISGANRIVITAAEADGTIVGGYTLHEIQPWAPANFVLIPFNVSNAEESNIAAALRDTPGFIHILILYMNGNVELARKSYWMPISAGFVPGGGDDLTFQDKIALAEITLEPATIAARTAVALAGDFTLRIQNPSAIPASFAEIHVNGFEVHARGAWNRASNSLTFNISATEAETIIDNLSAGDPIRLNADWYDAASGGARQGRLQLTIGIGAGGGGGGLDQRAVDQRIQAARGDATPVNTGTAGAGDAEKWSREDHDHGIMVLSRGERLGLMAMEISPGSVPDRSAASIARTYSITVTNPNVIDADDNWYEVHIIDQSFARKQWIRGAGIQSFQFDIDNTMAAAIAARSVAASSMRVEVRFFAQESGGVSYGSRTENVSFGDPNQGVSQREVEQLIATEQTVLFSEDEVEPTAANADRLLYRGKRLYTNEEIGKTADFRALALADIQAVWSNALSWGGVVGAARGATTDGRVVFVTEETAYAANTWQIAGGGGWSPLPTNTAAYAARWADNHRVADEAHAVQGAKAINEWFEWGGNMMLVTRFSAATHREWVEYERSEPQDIDTAGATSQFEVNADISEIVNMALKRDITLTIVGGHNGDTLILYAIQDSTGGRNISYGGANIEGLSTDADAVDAIAFVRRGAAWVQFGSVIQGAV